MQTSFTDLVGTTIAPVHCFDSGELTDLVPAMDTATAIHDMADQGSEARGALGSAGRAITTVPAYCDRVSS